MTHAPTDPDGHPTATESEAEPAARGTTAVLTADPAVVPIIPAASSPRWNAPIRMITSITAVLVLLTGAATVVGFFLVRTSSADAFFTDPVTRIQVTDQTGDVVIRAGTSTQGAIVTSRTRSAFHTATHGANVRDGVLTVSGTCRGSFPVADGCSVDFEITVPPGTAVAVTSETGDVTVHGGTGPVTVASNTGSIRVRQASGALRMTTNVGDVTGSLLRGGAVIARTNTGDVRLGFSSPPDQVDARSSTGDVLVGVPADSTAYRVLAHSTIGDRHVDVPTAPGSARVVELRTNTGDVRIGPAS